MTLTRAVLPKDEQSTKPVAVAKGLKFSDSNNLQAELRRRVDELFRSTGRRQRDCPQMYLKTAILPERIDNPAMSKIVEKTCREFGVRYAEHASFRAGVASHYRWLRQMGMRDGGGSEKDAA